ncbi:MAG: CpcT/CpeT family chromophore lyase [Phycisphaerales bacterium JB060]
MHRYALVTIATLAAVLAPAWLACAQQGPQARPAVGPESGPEPSVFAGSGVAAQSDAGVARLTSMLEGSWKTTEPVGQGEEARTLWMHMLPFETELLGRAIYVEVHPDGTPWEPVRQAIFRVYRYGGELRLRTYEFRDAERAEVLANLWLAPEHMPLDDIKPGELLPTRDLAFERGRGGFEGQTTRPYPTGERGSVEMTSQMRVRPDRIVSEDTFYGLDGSPIPGSGAITWERGTLPATVEVSEDGLVVITLEEGKTDGPPTDEGDLVFLHYDARQTTGELFDSTWEQGLAMRVAYPLRVVGGFKKGIEPLVEGMRRKLIIPPELGFGDVEMQNLPANSTLVFHIKVLRVEQTDAIPMEERNRRPEQEPDQEKGQP